MRSLLAIFPHPDDETFTAAGVMASATERGIPVILICATRGEAGESSIPGLRDEDKLGAVREEELREAMRQIGVSDVRFLDYRDSGMEGSPEAEHERAFVRVPVEEVASRLANQIREIQPGVIVTFGPEGVYGHPDHLHLHQAAVRAVMIATDPAYAGPPATPWQTPRLYFGTAPREEMLAMFERPNSPLASLSETARANLGTPRAEITHTIDTDQWKDAKREAVIAHRTQTGEGGPLSGMDPNVVKDRLRWEHFVHVPLPWAASADGSDVIDQLQAEQAGT